MHPVRNDRGRNRGEETSARPAGLHIDEVYAGSPAQSAGLLAGDLLIAVNGRPVESPRALQRLVAHSRPADTLRVTVQRESQSHEFSVALAELPELLVERGVPQPPAKGSADAATMRADGIRDRIAALKKELAELQAGLVGAEKRKK
jgi:membrane-associated protease RseP (regulator of RpoE activity)